MSFRNNRKRSSSINTSILLTRRSSINPKDIEYIQNTLQRTKKISNHFLLIILIISPLFIFTYYSLLFYNFDLFKNLINLWHFFEFFNLKSWIFVLLFIQLQLLFFWCVPVVERFATTKIGQQYIVRQNSFDSSLIFCLIYIFGGLIGIYKGNLIFEIWPNIMLTLTICSILLQFYLFIFWPKNLNGNDYSSKGSLITCSLLQAFHVGRQQWYEYLRWNLDNQSDRAGFYRLWGYIVFLPTLYLTPITLLAQTNKSASNILCGSVLLMGLCVQLLNTRIDLQKYEFRRALGRYKIGNVKDPFYITAKYRKENGDSGTELLLGSGYWGIARHLNYTTEFLSFALWTLTANKYPQTYFPLIFLAILLYGRMNRDELRCLIKYAHYWLQYTSKVPYLIVPGIY